MNLYQGDSKYADSLKDAFIKGFGIAEKAYGGKGKLPSVCYETYDKVIDMFDSWGKEATSEELTAQATTLSEMVAQFKLRND